ncbi:MAG: helix-turn-helix domain-containing protein [Solirubrobacteraceae bacterium]
MSTATTSTDSPGGFDVRSARQAVGLTRAQLAVRADCSLASLGNIEAGVIPRRSAVLERVAAVLAPETTEGPAGNGNGTLVKNGDAAPHGQPT